MECLETDAKSHNWQGPGICLLLLEKNNMALASLQSSHAESKSQPDLRVKESLKIFYSMKTFFAILSLDLKLLPAIVYSKLPMVFSIYGKAFITCDIHYIVGSS